MYRLTVLILLIPFFSSCNSKQENETSTIEKEVSAKQPKLFAEGIISTGDYETHPAFSPSGDTVYFLKCTPDMNLCVICVSYKKNGAWTKPEVVPFSGKYVDVDPFVTKDGNTIYFASNRPVEINGAVKPDWDIWKVQRTDTSWGEPVHLDSPFNSSASEYFPTIADNGNFYFGSSREGGKGRADIYVSKFANGQYTTIQNIGDSVNTADNEYEPFIAPDESYLIYMATVPNGLANADFYISYNRNGKWSKGKKISEPVNSLATEWGGKVTRDGKYFFFGSSRSLLDATLPVLPRKENMQEFENRINSCGNGLGDIYYVDISAIEKK